MFTIPHVRRALVCAAGLSLCLLTAACTSYQTPAETAAAARATPWPRVAVPDGEIEYRVTGIGEPVLLIHGSVLADVFDPLITQPALAGYQLIRYHRRGYAGSTRVTPPFTIAQQAADAFALLDNLQLQRVHVLGHSYGGTIALQMAKAAPDRVATLLLLEAAVPSIGAVDPKMVEALSAAYALYGKGDKAGALRTFGEAIAPGSTDAMAKRAPHMLEQAVNDAQTFFEVEVPALQTWQYGTADLAKLRMPALVVAGQLTPASFRSSHYGLMKDITGAEEMVVRGVGHELQMQDPKAVAEGIAAFLKKRAMR